MPEYQSLLTQREGNTLIVTVNRPKALNAINVTVMSELGQLFNTDIKAMEGLRAVILCGAGEKSFVAGADIKEFLSLTGNQGRDMSEKGQNIFMAIERCSVPVIAAIQGYALGAGCELAMACHMRIAGERARFGQPEVNLGLIPGYGGTQRLVELIGRTKAIELLLTADMIDANEAKSLGLVNHVVPQGDEIAKAKEIIAKIEKKAPLAVTGVIESVHAFSDNTMDGYAAEVQNFGKCCNTQDFREGATAFVEKRAANFIGR